MDEQSHEASGRREAKKHVLEKVKVVKARGRKCNVCIIGVTEGKVKGRRCDRPPVNDISHRVESVPSRVDAELDHVPYFDR